MDVERQLMPEHVPDGLAAKARAGRRKALAALGRGAKGVAMLAERERPPRLTIIAAQRFMTAA